LAVFVQSIRPPARRYVPATAPTLKAQTAEALKPRPTPEVQRLSRILYAKVIDQKMVDAGFEMTTKATGKQNTVLHIKYALTGRVTSNAIGKGLGFAQLRELGFKKVVMTNGFADELEETYTWTVQ